MTHGLWLRNSGRVRKYEVTLAPNSHLLVFCDILFVFWLARHRQFVFWLVVSSIISINRRLSHRTITVCHFISDYNAVWRLPFFWTTTVPRHVLIVALGVHAHVVLTRTPLLKEARRKRVFLGGGGRRRSWPIIDENSASNLNYVHFFIEAASIKSSKNSSRTSRPRRHFWVINPGSFVHREALTQLWW